MKRIALPVLMIWTMGAAERPIDYITQADIKAHMFFLASDEMAGRDAASPQAQITADYIAAEFMRMGLKPIGDSGTYFQNFDMVIGPLDRENTSLSSQDWWKQEDVSDGARFQLGPSKCEPHHSDFPDSLCWLWRERSSIWV